MTSAVTVLLNYSADGLRKLSVPSQTVNPGETVKIYLWAKTRADLDGYDLRQGPDTLGRGVLRQYPGQIEEQYFELAGDGALQDFDWPVVSLASVTAYGNLYADIDGAVSLVALPGEDVTRLFKLSGNSLARNVEAGAPKLFGTVRARSNRAPWCLEWAWTVPGGGVTVADNYDFGRTPLLYFDASVIAAGEGQVLTSLADRLGNLITLSGFMRRWYIAADIENDEYELLNYNGEYSRYYPWSLLTKSWDGIVQTDAKLWATYSTFFTKSAHKKSCIRLSSTIIKRSLYGSGTGLVNPTIFCNIPYSVTLEKTLFFISSGCESYALGRTPSDNYIPCGYDPREIVDLRIGGNTYDNIKHNHSNIVTYLCLSNTGGYYYSPGWDKQYSSTFWWSGPGSEYDTGQNVGTNYFIAKGKYPSAILKVYTLEINASLKAFKIYENGKLVETLECIEDNLHCSSFPISYLSFATDVYHYNNTYDTMGVRYQTHQDIYTALLFDGLFDTAKRQAIEAYLMTKWGIAA